MSTRPDEAFRERVIRWAAALDDREFAELFYEAVATRVTSELEDWRGHYVLADAERVGSDPWSVDFIGTPAPGVARNPQAEVPCKLGRCAGCGVRVRTWCRVAACPVCEARVFCS